MNVTSEANPVKVLFITPQDMYDIYGGGGAVGSQKCLKLVQEFYGEQNVHVCVFSKKRNNKEITNMTVFRKIGNPLEALFAALCGCKVYLPWDEKKIVQVIRKYKPDLLFIDYSTLGRLVKYKNLAKKTIVFFYNVESDYTWNKVKNVGPHYLPAYWASKYNDRWGIQADKIICITKRDSDRLYKLYGRGADLFVPCSFYDLFDINKTITDYKRSVLFLGSMFPPNQLSIEWFIKEVMPKLNHITLDIVGKGFEEKKEAYEKNEGVTVIGSVKELGEYYYNHAVVVSPILFGAGMKTKIAEAMMYGRTIIASDEALEGYDIEGVKGIIRCNTADEFAEAINTFFSQNSFKGYQEDVRRKFLEKYNTKVVQEEFNEFLQNVFD